MRLLLAYSTIEGMTHDIAERVAEQLTAGRHEVRVVDVAEAPVDLSARAFDAIIVAGSVHIGSYAKPLLRWVKAHRDALQATPTAFLSVSLTAAGDRPEDPAALAGLVATMVDKTGWHPATVHHVAGALRYTKYGWLKRWMMKRISAARGGPTDTSRDHTLTDWNDLAAFIDRFVEAAADRSDRSDRPLVH